MMESTFAFSAACALGQVLRSHELSLRIDALTDAVKASAEVIESDSANLSLWRTSLGEFWFPADSATKRLANCLAEQEAGVYSSKVARVGPGDVVLECGANVGTFARKASSLGAKLVVAIEPAPQNLECLRRNLAPVRSAGETLFYHRGLWDCQTTLVLSMDNRNPLKHSVVADRGGNLTTEIAVNAIDQVVRELQLNVVDFLKMDVEGAELKALAGGRETIRKHKPVLAIAVEHGSDLIENARNVVQLVRDIHPGYRWDCSYCEQLPSGLIFPEVLIFYDPARAK